MAGISISSYDSSSVSTLFSSLNTSNSALSGLDLTMYSQIKSGSYGKLLKAYYSELYGNSSSTSSSSSTSTKKTTSTAKDSTETLAKIQDAAESVTDSVDALRTTGTFSKSASKDANGNATYDVDGIYKKVSSFVDSYNSLLKKGESSSTSKISSATESMDSITQSNEKALSKIGITIDEDEGTLSIDKDTFSKADMASVKKLFGTTGSYAYQVSLKASMINSYATTESYKSNTYTGSGQYTYNYSSGQIYQTEA